MPSDTIIISGGLGAAERNIIHYVKPALKTVKAE